jgi:hypothetical protein
MFVFARRKCIALLAASIFATVPEQVLGQSCPWGVTAQSPRSDVVVLNHSWYDYEPTIMLDGKYRMWWCGSTGVGGDKILYAEATAMNGPWSSPVAVFQPTGNSANFDGVHTCDPSVIRVRGTYYLYYGGWNDISYPNPGAKIGEIGVATSTDGLNWTRLNGGQSIVRPARNIGDPNFASLPNKYGAGQPSITYLNGLFYLVYTDTTGYGGNQSTGQGVYVLRSSDPTFQSGVEELVGAGAFAVRTPANHTSYPLITTFAVDWQFVDMTGSFAVAESRGNSVGTNITRIYLYDQNLTAVQSQLDVPGDWHSGPGLVSRPDKHAVPSTQCGIVPFDVFKATGPADPLQWELAHAGVDWNTGLSCSCSNPPKVFEGEGIRAPSLPWGVVIDGKRAQFAVAASLTNISKNMWDLTSTMYNLIPYGASIFSGNYTIYTDAMPGAFVLDDGRRWPISCYDLVVANSSSLTYVTPAQYAAYPLGSTLWCVK